MLLRQKRPVKVRARRRRGDWKFEHARGISQQRQRERVVSSKRRRPKRHRGRHIGLYVESLSLSLFFWRELEKELELFSTLKKEDIFKNATLFPQKVSRCELVVEKHKSLSCLLLRLWSKTTRVVVVVVSGASPKPRCACDGSIGSSFERAR